MNVSLQNIDKVSGLLTVKIEKADYQEKVDKSLKSIRKNAQMPGFRKGMVPMGMVKKMYLQSVMSDEVNKLLQEGINNYIKENDVKVLGEPMPNDEKQQPIDLASMEDFEFFFDLAIAPEVKVELSKDDKVDFYNIQVSDEMIDDQLKGYTQRTGSHEKVEEYQENDMTKGLLVQLDAEGNAKEDGIKVEGAVLMPSYMKNDEQKAIFNNVKVNDVVVFNPAAAYENDAEVASLLKLDKEIAADVKDNFSYQIEEITRFVPGELTQEIFDQVCGEGVVKTEEEFRQKVSENIAKQLEINSDYRFLIDARKVITDKVGKLEFSEKLLKRILLANKSENESEESLDESYDKNIEELSWHLIKEQLASDFEIKVEQEDVMNMAKETTRMQFAQYGMMEVPEDLLNNYAQEMLKKQESVNQLVSRAIDAKLTQVLKKKVSLKKKKTTLEKFNKLFQ